MKPITTNSETELRQGWATPGATLQLPPQRTAKLGRAYRLVCHWLLNWRHLSPGRWGGSDAEREAEEKRSGARGQGLEDRGQGLEACASSTLCLPPSAQEKGTVPICRNGAPGAEHKWGLSPFPASFRGYSLLRLAVALLLLTAGALKGYDLSTGPVAGNGLFDSRWFLIGVVEMELLFGLWLLADILPKPTWVAALACFSLFTCVSLYKAVAGYATCGCFGRVPVNPWYTATIDLGIVLSLLRWRPPVPSPSGRGQGEGASPGEGRVRARPSWPFTLHHSSFSIPRRATAALIVWLSVGLPAAYAMTSYTPTTLSATGNISGDGKVIVLEPEKWIGKTLPLLDHIDIGSRLTQGRWLILLYHQDCPKCQEAIPKYRQLSDELLTRGDKTQVALIEVPPYGEDTSGVVSLQGQCAVGRLNDAKQWFVQTPLELILDRAVVTNVNMGQNAEN